MTNDNIEDMKDKMHRIVTEPYENGFRYSADVRVGAAQAYALLAIAEKLDKKE